MIQTPLAVCCRFIHIGTSAIVMSVNLSVHMLKDRGPDLLLLSSLDNQSYSGRADASSFCKIPKIITNSKTKWMAQNMSIILTYSFISR